MTTAANVWETARKAETRCAERLKPIGDSVCDLASSDEQQDGEDKEDDEDDT
jgi:hypothetical protein